MDLESPLNVNFSDQQNASQECNMDIEAIDKKVDSVNAVNFEKLDLAKQSATNKCLGKNMSGASCSHVVLKSNKELMGYCHQHQEQRSDRANTSHF